MESHDSEYAEYAAQNAAEYAEENKVTASKIRAWLKEQGIKVSDAGVIAKKYVTMYHAYHNTPSAERFEFGKFDDATEKKSQAAWKTYAMEPEAPTTPGYQYPTGMDAVWRRTAIAYLEIASLAFSEATLRVNQVTPSFNLSVQPLANEDMSAALAEIANLCKVATFHLDMISERVDQAIENNTALMNTEELMGRLRGLLNMPATPFESPDIFEFISAYPPGLVEGSRHNCGNPDCPVLGYENSEEGELQYARDIHDGVKPLPDGAALAFDPDGEPRLMFAGPVAEGDKTFDFRPPTFDEFDGRENRI